MQATSYARHHKTFANVAYRFFLPVWLYWQSAAIVWPLVAISWPVWVEAAPIGHGSRNQCADMHTWTGPGALTPSVQACVAILSNLLPLPGPPMAISSSCVAQVRPWRPWFERPSCCYAYKEGPWCLEIETWERVASIECKA